MARTKAKNQDNGDGFSFVASQGSDDQMYVAGQAAIQSSHHSPGFSRLSPNASLVGLLQLDVRRYITRFVAAKEKKKKETEKKFLVAGQKHLLKEVCLASTLFLAVHHYHRPRTRRQAFNLRIRQCTYHARILTPTLIQFL